MNGTEIKSATAAEKKIVIDTITLAFSSDPIMRWIYPDARSFIETGPNLFDAMAGNSLLTDSCFISPGCTGVAMWLGPGVKPDESLLAPITKKIRPEIMEDLMGLLDEVETYHPKDDNLWFLPLIGVDPAHRGKGLGSALMEYATQKFDSLGVPAYLESSNPQNVSLYLRHGFEVMAEVQCGSSPVMRPMLRVPR